MIPLDPWLLDVRMKRILVEVNLRLVLAFLWSINLPEINCLMSYSASRFHKMLEGRFLRWWFCCVWSGEHLW